MGRLLAGGATPPLRVLPFTQQYRPYEKAGKGRHNAALWSIPYFPATFAQVSFSGTVRLNTGRAAVESGSLQK